MKYLTSQVMNFARSGDARQNLRILARYLIIVALMVIVYTLLFHVLMSMEGQSHSWLTGFYWTLTVMSTLGFGDITFQSDAGRFFSLVVLLSGVVVLLILLPFTFIEFFYAPWLEAQRQRRAPRSLPAGTHGHVLITDDEPVARDFQVLASVDRTGPNNARLRLLIVRPVPGGRLPQETEPLSSEAYRQLLDTIQARLR